MYLETALIHWRTSAPSNLASNRTSRAHPGLRDKRMDATHAIANLFLKIGMQSDIDEIAASVGNVNDRLHRARIAEQLLIAESREEISALGAAYERSDRAKLRTLIRRYHKARLQILPAICREMLSMAFANR
jgi:hypothetical protein